MQSTWAYALPSHSETLRAVVCEREHRIRPRLAALEEVGLRAYTPFFTPSGSARPAPATARVFGHSRPTPSFAWKPTSRQAARNLDYVALLAPTEPLTPRTST